VGGINILLNYPQVVPLGDHFVTDGRSAEYARVIIFITIGQDEEESLPHGNGLFAFGAEEFLRIKVFVGFSPHII